MMNASAHVVRKGGVADTAFDHKVHDLQEVQQDDSDTETAETKDQYFEFSDSYGIMRLVRLILVVQVIALVLDHPTIRIAHLFDIFCRGFLYYAIHFYSRPFIDILYVLQLFWVSIKKAIEGGRGSLPDDVEVTHPARRLNSNPYLHDGQTSVPAREMGWDVDLLDDQNWHTVQYYSHYFLGILFIFLALLFTLRFWELKDYSDREEIKRWLQNYIADGWWHRGGFNIIKSTASACAFLGLMLLIINSIANSFAADSISNGVIFTSVVAIGMAVVGVIWAISTVWIKITEKAFLRYVSQNVAYTSVIILKRAVKAKFDLGVVLMMALFMPVLYTLLQAQLMFLDWNDTTAKDFRVGGNFYIPCYFLAFPPFRVTRLDPDTCPVADQSSSVQTLGGSGFYSIQGILPCDSYLGIIIQTISSALFVYILLAYFYLFACMIHQVVGEFKASKWVDVLLKLLRIREEEENDYNSRFTLVNRVLMAIRQEINLQLANTQLAVMWTIDTNYFLICVVVRNALKPVLIILAPLRYLLLRFFVVIYLCFTKSPVQQRKLRKSFALTSTPGNPTRRRSSLFKSFSAAVLPTASQEEDDGDMHGFAAGVSGKSGGPTSPSRRLSRAASRGALLRSRSSVRNSMRGMSSSRMNSQVDMSFFTETPSFRDSSGSGDVSGLWPSTLSAKRMKVLMKKVDIFQMAYDFSRQTAISTMRAFIRSRPVVWVKLHINLLRSKLFQERREDGSMLYGIASLGGAYAPWRKELTLQSKTRLLDRMREHNLAELRLAKRCYISDHELVISSLDYVLDTAGLTTLVIPYDYHRMYCFLLVLLECTAYVLLAATLSRYTTWSNRNLAIMAVDVFFGFVTYVLNPYTETTDKWLDFAGRLLIFFITTGLVFTAQLNSDSNDAVSTYLYEPWKNRSYILAVLSGEVAPSLYLALDILMVICFYFYVLYTCALLGVFGVLDRICMAFLYRGHDAVLDFLVFIIERRTFGMEQMGTGLIFLQQWDDIIRSQRRYALLTTPDVRPPDLIPWIHKYMEIKWAALFNLTLDNLRSSLGLSLLHTTIFNGQSDAARWMLCRHPHLLQVPDSQNDSPLTIALKECAYYLYVYGAQEDGNLEDQTSYGDEAYALIYPEVDEIREQIHDCGEFLPEFVVTITMTAQQLIDLKTAGYYCIPAQMPSEDELKRAIADEKNISNPLPIVHSAARKLEKLYENQHVQAQKHRLRIKRANQEKASIYRKRFPEDDDPDDWEAGGMKAWTVLGWSVPRENIYLDASIVKYMKTHPDYHYANTESSAPALSPDQRPTSAQAGAASPSRRAGSHSPAKGRGAAGLPSQALAAATNPHAAAETTNQLESGILHRDLRDHLSTHADPDLQYVIPTNKRIHSVPFSIQAPLDHEIIKSLRDFDIRRKSKKSGSRRGSSSGMASGDGAGDSGSESSSVYSQASQPDTAIGLSKSNLAFLSPAAVLSIFSPPERINLEKNARWNICKFAEILLSEEMIRVQDMITWNVSDFKALARIASSSQGKISQHLAFVCNFHPPEGFVRISDWSVDAAKEVYYEKPEEAMNMVIKTMVAVVTTTEKTAMSAIQTVQKLKKQVMDIKRWKSNRYSMKKRMSSRGSSRGQRTPRSSYGGNRSSRQDGEDGEEGGEADAMHTIEGEEGMLSDRVVQYLAEALVSSRTALTLDDCELSNNARRGWRAICRALRQKYCSFVLPSLCTPPKPIILKVLKLPRNELDCGDAVYLADVFTHQLLLETIDLSHNHIGSRGMMRMCKALRTHNHLQCWEMQHNSIGPAAGKDIGLFLKASLTIAILDLSHNQLGEIHRFPTLLSRGSVPSAAHDLTIGLKLNKSLQILNLSYNHLGPTLAEALPLAIMAHPCLHTLDISGNDLGPEKGALLIFALAGMPRGAEYAKERDAFVAKVKRNQIDKAKEAQETNASTATEAMKILERKEAQAISMASQAGQDYSAYADLEVLGKRSQILDSESAIFGDISRQEVVDPTIERYLPWMHADQGYGRGNAANGGGGGPGTLSLPSPSKSALVKSPPKKAAKKKKKKPSQLENGGDDESSSVFSGSSSMVSAPGGGGGNGVWAKNASSVLEGPSGVLSGGGRRERSIEESLTMAFGEAMRRVTKPAMNLTSLSVADNQLGPFSGHAIAHLLLRIKGLTHLNVSGNSLGPIGGERIADQLELLHKVIPRDFLKRVLYEIEESKYSPTHRNPKKRKKIYTNLVSLEMARNNFGPKVMASLMVTLGTRHCGIAHFNISDNPIGLSNSDLGGNAFEAAVDIRHGFSSNPSLTGLNLNLTQFASTDLVTIFGGLRNHCFLRKLSLQDVIMDEPAALQLGNVLNHVSTLVWIDLARCRMGPNGGVMIAQKLKQMMTRVEFIDLTSNNLGPIPTLLLGEGIQASSTRCTLHTLRLGYNDCLEEGGSTIAKALIGNLSVTEVDLSGNMLTAENARYLSDAVRGLFRNGTKVRDSVIRTFRLNDNPLIGKKASKVILKAMANNVIENIELRNIGLGPGCGEILSQYLRDPYIAWQSLDLSRNGLTRMGLNAIFWAMRQNKRLRVLRVSENQASNIFCSDADALLDHGIAVPRAIESNVVLRELDLSYNSISSAGAMNVLDAMLENFTIKKLSLRGNLLDDLVAPHLSALLDGNEVLEELDLGRNRMGFTCLFEISTTLATNRRLCVLLLDNNSFGGAGVGTLDSFTRAIMMNYSLKILDMDGNKLGPEWGLRLAETLARNNTLVQVSLRNNRFDARAGLALLNAYRFCKYLLELALTADEVGMEVWEAFRAVFMEKRACVDPTMLREETALSSTQATLLQSYKY